MTREIKLVGALFVGLLAGTSAVQAQSNKDLHEAWCLESQRGAVIDCLYPSLAACEATRNGEGGSCIPNPENR